MTFVTEFEGATVATRTWGGDGVDGVALGAATISTDEAAADEASADEEPADGELADEEPADEEPADEEPGDSNRELGESTDWGLCPAVSS